MAWLTLTDAEIAALIGTIDFDRTGVGIVADVINDDAHREPVA